ncbi:MAG: FlgD immunoglobulin-like domain containing protein, partial [Pseudonocardiaceae bacterium]
QVYLRCVGFASGTCGWVGTLTEDRRPLQVAVTVPAGADRLTIGIWDRFGEHVRQLLDEPQPTQGPRTVDWDVTDDTGQQLDDGSFLLRVTVDGQSESQIVHVKR